MKRMRTFLILTLLLAALPLTVSAARLAAETPVYGWVGTIYAYSRPAYDDYFVRNDGELHGITGKDATVELQITGLRGLQVQLWGTAIDPAPDFNGRQIVVDQILRADTVPTIPPPSTSRVTLTVTASVANVRTGPSTAYPRVTYAYAGDTFNVVGRNAANTWYQICCPAQRSAWIAGSIVTTVGRTLNLPVIPVAPPAVPTPTPTPVPTPVAITDWRGEYYSNSGLQGQPAVVRNDPTLDFNWGDKSPAPGIPNDDFSARWTRTLPFSQGNYRFYAQSDDGIRVWLDNWLLINEWRFGPLAAAQDFASLGAGNHTVRVEYYEHLGDAKVKVWWQQTDIFQNWRGEYYDNIYLNPPSVLVRDDQAVDFNWGLGSPAPQVPTDNFGARWTRSVYFDSGDYRFRVSGGDGVRVRLDGWSVIDHWLVDDRTEFSGTFKGLGSGYHTVEMDWYSRGGIALVKLWWEKETYTGGPTPD